MSRAADLELLGLPGSFSLAELKATYRLVATNIHPDHGGSTAAFAEVTEAYRRLLVEAEAIDVLCSVCRGSGRITIPGPGFLPLTRACDTCGGSGKRA